MSLHSGQPYGRGNVALTAPEPRRIREAHHDDDVHDSVAEWLSRAEGDPNIYYFAVHTDGELVGQIFLHDIDEVNREALVGYHLFEKRSRGHGVGTAALRLLQDFVVETTSLTKLILVASSDNVASRRAAEKAGCVFIGAPREDANGVLLVWEAGWNTGVYPR